MPEETATLSTGTEKTEDTATAPSTSADKADGMDIDTEAKRLMGAGQRHLVMKDVRSSVTSFQEASSLLAKKYGETADECAEAFYSYGTSLLELARMENGVLGNALEGMPEDEEEGEKEEDANIPSADNLDEKEREQLRDQVYDAMAEEERAPKETSESEALGKPKDESKPMDTDEQNKPVEDKMKNGNMETGKVTDGLKLESVNRDVSMDESEKGEVPESKNAPTPGEHTEQKEKSEPKESKAPEKKDTKDTANQSPDSTEVAEERAHTDTAEKMDSEASAKTEEGASKTPTGNEASKSEDPEKMKGEEEEGEDSEESEENESTEEKETEDEDVGNLQLAWEMLDLSKMIFKRQKSREAQLKAAQAHLKLGEVSTESENYAQAVEDFLACLDIQKEHLEEHDRLLAETHYHLGLAYQYSSKHEEAISHFTQSVGVIEKRMDVLTKQLEALLDETAEEVKKEMDELKDLLPDIKEKIEDSKEAQKNATVAKIALKETLVGGSSGFSQENTAVEKSGDSTVPVTNCVSDISHLIRKKRKPGEESPLKDKDAKKPKQEPVANGAGNGDAVVPTNEEVEKAEEVSMETATVESTA
ncbi:uncharacterized protein LOC734974 [Xenopus laevis]|uniref:MGC132155 protein n=1 Tax=Xenopus laevis TaxID=8355 RepID=Q2VPH0_XENLA|nr:Histone-binding protein N1/N2-like [Xenopus laevis]AAI08800.1 MGC132155 protein [Xenopus laevis]